MHKIPCKYSHVDQSYSNFEFSVAAILKIQNGGRYCSQITCLHFLYDSNNKKLSIHKISCFYDNLNNIATNRSTIVLIVRHSSQARQVINELQLLGEASVQLSGISTGKHVAGS